MKSNKEDVPTTESLFLGDTGEMALETRKALNVLMLGPSLEAKRHSNLWPVLIRDEAIIRSRLCEHFLDLVIDRDLEVAFTRQADTGELEIPKLLRRAPLTFLDSVLLLFLRQQLTRFENQGERAAVSSDEMMEYLFVYEKSANTDRAGFLKRAQASIVKLKKYSILRTIRNSADRYEISPTLKLLFSAEEVREMAEIYRRFAEGALHLAPMPEETDEESSGDEE